MKGMLQKFPWVHIQYYLAVIYLVGGADILQSPQSSSLYVNIHILVQSFTSILKMLEIKYILVTILEINLSIKNC